MEINKRKFTDEELGDVAMFNCTYGGMNLLEPNDANDELIDTWGNGILIDIDDNVWIIEEDGKIVKQDDLDTAIMFLLDK